MIEQLKMLLDAARWRAHKSRDDGKSYHHTSVCEELVRDLEGALYTAEREESLRDESDD